MAKQLISVRLSRRGNEVLKGLAETLGITQAAVIELALRTLAEKDIASYEPNKTLIVKAGLGLLR